MMKINDMLIDIAKDAWIFEAWSNHEEHGIITYTVKLTCGVQARGRKSFTSSVFEVALAESHLYATGGWKAL